MFIQIPDLIQMVADGFFMGNTEIVSMMLFVAVLATIFVFVHNAFMALLIGIPVALVFRSMGVLSSDLMVLLIIISVLGLAATARKTAGDT